MVFSGLFLEGFEINNLILIYVIYWIFKKKKFFKISSNPFHVTKTNRNEKELPYRVQFVMDYKKMPFRSTNFITLHGLLYRASYILECQHVYHNNLDQ